MKDIIRKQIGSTIGNLTLMAEDDKLMELLELVTGICIDALKQGSKIIFAGNGGSAADSQHLAAELISRFHYDRPALPAMALTTNTSTLTAIGNDYGYDRLFARQLEGVGSAGDVLFAISTSGRSPNILEVVRTARDKGIIAVGMTGSGGGELAQFCDHCLRVPSDSTPRIQEGHIVMGHIICQLIEAELFPKT